MVLAVLQTLVVPRPEILFTIDPVTGKVSISMKLTLWPGISLVGTIWLNEDFRPAIGVQVVTMMSEQMANMSPAHPWRLI